MSTAETIFDILLRFGAIGAVFFLMVIWEVNSPARSGHFQRRYRWFGNIALAAINNVVLRLLPFIMAVSAARMADIGGYGVFNVIHVPFPIEVILSIVLLDLVIYFQHVLMHRVPLLWRLHGLHHSDRDLDVTTAVRFHPIEIVVSMMIKFVAVIILGADIVAVIAFEIILAGMAMFNHGNVSLPKALEPKLRNLVVTPEMHRVHHSENPMDFNKNFGFNLSIWDRLFGTYAQEPCEGSEKLSIGLQGLRSHYLINIIWMLTYPFKGDDPGMSEDADEEGLV